MTELGTMPPPAASESDEQALLQRLRNGEDAAFGELFELHAAAVRRLAQSLAQDRSEAEDITAETFFRVLQALRRGAGPRDYIRAYLLTVARRVSWEWHGARRDVPVSDDELTFRAGAGADTHQRTAEHTLITTAFTSLPERWRTVLVPAAAGGGGLAGLGTTLKSVLLGSKVKVGLALASTAAVGAVGVAAGPVLTGSNDIAVLGLTGGAPELMVVPPSPSHQQPPPAAQPPRYGYGVLNGRGTPREYRPVSPHIAANEVPQLPANGVDAPQVAQPDA